jgi:spore coat protein U-like protein
VLTQEKAGEHRMSGWFGTDMCQASIRKSVIILFFLVLFGSVVNSQQVVNTQIVGVVPVEFNVASTVPKNSVVDLVHANSARIGQIFVNSNTKGVWNISVDSLNKGVLRGMTAGNSDVYPYQLQFGDFPTIDLKNSYIFHVNMLVPNAVIEYDVMIRYTSFENLPIPVSPDTYTDTVTITFSAL